MQRQLKKEVKIGNIKIGGTNPIAVQTMLNVPVKDIAGNVAQAERVAKAGCQIVRVTVPTPADAAVVAAIKEKVDIPVVADIHFDYRAALAALDAGADKIRINPGNIGDDDRVKAVADACNARNVPIRIGVNGGSLEKHILAKYGAPVPEAMVESAMYHVRLLQKYDFDNIVISIKSSNVPRMMAAYRLLASQTDYPLHVGVTEAGGNRMGLIKSGMGIGGLLMEGIGDTLRVSLTDEPENEVYAGYDILRAAGYAVAGPEIISCPTCGRTQYPMIEIANEVEARLRDEGFKKPLKIAIMGCVVNGPGEASDADIGIAGGKDEALLFIRGEKIRMLKGDIVGQLLDEIHKMCPPKAFPPWGKVAPQGRMRGKLSSAIRLRVMPGNFALISPLRGQLPPRGKPTLVGADSISARGASRTPPSTKIATHLLRYESFETICHPGLAAVYGGPAVLRGVRQCACGPCGALPHTKTGRHLPAQC